MEGCCRARGVKLRAIPLQPPEAQREATISFLLYADDIANINSEFRDAVAAFEELVAVFELNGLRINFGKTKFMTFNATADTPDSIHVNGHEIERLHDFDYLGSHFTDGSGSAELERKHGFDLAPVYHRLNKADARFSKMNKFFFSHASPELKTRVFSAFVYPVATWGSECWTYSSAVVSALDVWYRKKLRMMMRISMFEHVSNDELYRKAWARPLSEMLYDRRMGYFGHCARYPADRWVKFAIAGTVCDSGVGTAKLTWQKSIRADFKKINATWADCADRRRWAQILAGELVLENSGKADSAHMQTSSASARRHRSAAVTNFRVIEEVEGI